MRLSQVLRIFATFNIVAILTTPGMPQTSSRPTPVERRVEQMNRQGEQYDRDSLRKSDAKSRLPVDHKPAQATITQVKQDFARIQAVYNDLVSALSANSVNDKLVLEATGEINQRANRLKKNLALPQEDSTDAARKEIDLKQEQVNPSLRKLCRHIADFVTNPVFEKAGVLDVEQSAKASRDLQEIIDISEAIHRISTSPGASKK